MIMNVPKFLRNDDVILFRETEKNGLFDQCIPANSSAIIFRKQRISREYSKLHSLLTFQNYRCSLGYCFARRRLISALTSWDRPSGILTETIFPMDVTHERRFLDFFYI